MDKYEQTRQYLIEKYGDHKEKIIDGKIYRYINAELDNLDKLMNVFKQVVALYGKELKQEYINVICDFAISEVQPNVEIVIKKLDSLLKNKKVSKKSFEGLLQTFEEFYNDDKYNANFIMNFFVKYLKCANIYHRNTFRTLM